MAVAVHIACFLALKLYDSLFHSDSLGTLEVDVELVRVTSDLDFPDLDGHECDGSQQIEEDLDQSNEASPPVPVSLRNAEVLPKDFIGLDSLFDFEPPVIELLLLDLFVLGLAEAATEILDKDPSLV